MIMYNMRQKDFRVYICENQNGFVLYSSINHSRISVFTYSAKYQIIVYRPGGEFNSTIYCSSINCGVKDIGLEALRKVGTIIRTEIRVRLGQIIPVYRPRSTGQPAPQLLCGSVI